MKNFFLDQELIPYRYSSCCCCSSYYCCLAPIFKKPRSSFQIGSGWIWWDCSQLNRPTYRILIITYRRSLLHMQQNPPAAR